MMLLRLLLPLTFLLLTACDGRDFSIKYCDYARGEKVKVTPRGWYMGVRGVVVDITVADGKCWYEVQFDDPHVNPKRAIVREDKVSQ